jgi:2-oxoglutarate ferredoxin oxidoreductase subunit alpha
MVSPNPAENNGGSALPSAEARSLNDVVIRLAGNSQDGIQSVGGFLARLAGRSDQEVMTYMTIPSTISGGPSIFQVRMGTGDILSAGDRADMLVAFYQHSYESHIGRPAPGRRAAVRQRPRQTRPDDNRFTNVAVPITSGTVEAVGGTSKDKGKNIFVLGLIARIFDLDVQKLATLIKERFGGKNEDIVRNAMLAFDAGYAWPAEQSARPASTVSSPDRVPSGRPQVTTDGNIGPDLRPDRRGVRYGAAYPITPWSSSWRPCAPNCRNTAVSSCSARTRSPRSPPPSASPTGHLAITGSSGPGLSLKMEALGWAVMAEMPLIVDQRAARRSLTGMPTNVEQSDLMQAIYGSHGDTPRVVLAPKNVEDCFYIAIEAAASPANIQHAGHHSHRPGAVEPHRSV